MRQRPKPIDLPLSLSKTRVRFCTSAAFSSISKACCRCRRTVVTRPSSCGLLNANIAARIDEIAFPLRTRASFRNFTGTGHCPSPRACAECRAWGLSRQSRAWIGETPRKVAGVEPIVSRFPTGRLPVPTGRINPRHDFQNTGSTEPGEESLHNSRSGSYRATSGSVFARVRDDPTRLDHWE